jgi:pimeloyl-ACP methyl ester carboxylesterase
MATFVLVHGAFHGGWCWKKVSPLLRAVGHEVYTPTLTGLGERSHVRPADMTIDVHTQDIANVLEFEDLSNVVLVGHSYAGYIISLVAERMPERIAHLIYLDAMIPVDGESVKETYRYNWEKALPFREESGEDWWLEWHVAYTGDYGFTDETEWEWLSSRLTPNPMRTWLQPVSIKNPEAAALPHSFISCVGKEGRMSDQAAALGYKVAAKGWEFYTLPTGHDAMLSMPEGLTRLLLELV